MAAYHSAMRCRDFVEAEEDETTSGNRYAEEDPARVVYYIAQFCRNVDTTYHCSELIVFGVQ